MANRHRGSGRRRQSQPKGSRLPLFLVIGGVIVLIAAAIFALQGKTTPFTPQVTGGPSLKADKEKVDLGDERLGNTVAVSLEIMPGVFVENTLTFNPPGTYMFYCDRWCGRNHWRVRGTIEVAPADMPQGSGAGAPPAQEPQPLYLQLGIDVDAAHDAKILPADAPSAVPGSRFAELLPGYALEHGTYLAYSPETLWIKLRSEPSLHQLTDADLWDALARVWQAQTPAGQLAEGGELFANNCAACHGETGKGDGVMVRGLPELEPENIGYGLVRPPDFTGPRRLLRASPALLQGKIIRGGMGTGMPYCGPILTGPQIDALISTQYSFAWRSAGEKNSQ